MCVFVLVEMELQVAEVGELGDQLAYRTCVSDVGVLLDYDIVMCYFLICCQVKKLKRCTVIILLLHIIKEHGICEIHLVDHLLKQILLAFQYNTHILLKFNQILGDNQFSCIIILQFILTSNHLNLLSNLRGRQRQLDTTHLAVNCSLIPEYQWH